MRLCLICASCVLVVYAGSRNVLAVQADAKASPPKSKATAPKTLEGLLKQADTNPGPAKPVEAGAKGQVPSELPKDMPAPATERLPIPEKKSVEKALEDVEVAYKDECGQENADPCIQSLLKAVATTKDPARKYALLQKAELIAVGKVMAERGLEVAARRAVLFDVDPIDAQLSVIDKLEPQAKKKKNYQALCVLFRCADELLKQACNAEMPDVDRLKDVYDRTRTLGLDRTQWCKEKDLEAMHLRVEAEVQKAVTEWRYKAAGRRTSKAQAYREALDVLAKKNDPAAHAVVGKYRCIELEDWKNGLESLAQSDLEKAKAIAIEEIKARTADPADAATIYEIAGKWWDAPECLGGGAEERAVVRRYSARLYKSVEGKLSDEVEKNIAGKRFLEAGLSAEEMERRAALAKSMPEKAFQHNGHTYLILPQMNHASATRWCKEMGGHLAKIESPQEFQAVTQNLEKLNAELGKKGISLDETRFWVEGMYRDRSWIFDDGSKIPIATNVPYGYSDSALTIEVELNYGDRYSLRADDVSDSNGFICEWDWSGKSK